MVAHVRSPIDLLVIQIRRERGSRPRCISLAGTNNDKDFDRFANGVGFRGAQAKYGSNQAEAFDPLARIASRQPVSLATNALKQVGLVTH